MPAIMLPASNGYGNAIYINFGGGTSARFGHLSKFNVKPGDTVNAGDVIGYLHWESYAAAIEALLWWQTRRGTESIRFLTRINIAWRAERPNHSEAA